MKIVHIIPVLERGGAEHVLCRLIENRPSPEYEHEVICLRNKGPLAERLEKRGVKVQAVGLKSFIALPGAFLRLVKMLRKAKPDLVQTWMYHADLFGGLAARLSGSPPVIWSIRQSNFPPGGMRLFTRLAAWLSARLSNRLPDLIVANSVTGKNFHSGLGYDSEKIVVVPNGIDVDKFQPDPEAREEIRNELELDDSALFVGMFGRFHPQKDHQTFIRAALRLSKKQTNIHFLLCGRNVNENNKTLKKWIKQASLQKKIHLLGERSDMPSLHAALDLAVSSSSFAEGTSNTILEAMACAVPCVVTDIGDNPRLVDDRFVVPPENPNRLAETMEDILALPKSERDKIGKKNRKTIEENFSLAEMVGRFHELYRTPAG
jgi:glycosyltransferase involved in cell wall biosynthesis